MEKKDEKKETKEEKLEEKKEDSEKTSSSEKVSTSDESTDDFENHKFEQGFKYKNGKRKYLFRSDSSEDNEQVHKKRGRQNKYFRAVEEEDENDPDVYDDSHIVPVPNIKRDLFAPDEKKHHHHKEKRESASSSDQKQPESDPYKNHKFLYGIDKDTSSSDEEIDFPESSIALKRKLLMQKEIEAQEKRKAIQEREINLDNKEDDKKEEENKEKPKGKSFIKRKQQKENARDEVKEANDNSMNSPKKHKSNISPQVMEIFQQSLNQKPKYINDKSESIPPTRNPPQKTKNLILDSDEESTESDLAVKSPLKNKYLGIKEEPLPEAEPLNKPRRSFRTDPAKRSSYLK